jgi:hypothetical protein
MPRVAGDYTPPSNSASPAVPFTTIRSAAFNELITDIATALDAADQATAETGGDNTQLMTPLRTKQQVDARLSDIPTAEAGVDNEKLITPLTAKASIVANAQYGTWLQSGAGAVEQQILTTLWKLEVTPEQFGAANDGETPDDEAFDKAYNFLMTMPNGGILTLKAGDGYRLNAAHNIHPTKQLTIRAEAGSVIFNGLKGADAVLFRATHPTTAAGGAIVRGARLVLDSLRILPHSSVTGSDIGSITFEYRYASDLKFEGDIHFQHYRANTAVSLTSTWNCRLGKSAIWGAGAHFLHKNADGVTFSIASTTTTLTSSVAHFDGDDVGKAIFLNRSGAGQIFTIASVSDSQTAIVTEAARGSSSSVAGCWEGVRGSISSSSNTTTLTLTKNVLTSADIGRRVYIIGARSTSSNGARPLRARITNVSGTTVTIDTPATKTVTDAYVIFSPAVEIYTDAGGENVNDLIWRDLENETFTGTGLVVDGALNIHLPNVKLHAWNFTTETNPLGRSSMFAAVLAGYAGFFGPGDLEGATINNLGRVHVSDSFGLTDLAGWTGVGIEHQYLVHCEDNRTQGVVGLGNVVINNTVSSDTNSSAIRIVGSGQVDHYGVVAGGSSAVLGTAIRARRHIFSTVQPPASIGRVVAGGQGTTAWFESITNSPNLGGVRGVAYGGTFGAPSTVANFQAMLYLDGAGYTSTSGPLVASRIRMNARNPTATTVDGEINFATANAGGALTDRWIMSTAGDFSPLADNAYVVGGTTNRIANVRSHLITLVDGVTAPATVAGHATIYVDSADGDLKIKFGDGTIKTIITDT